MDDVSDDLGGADGGGDIPLKMPVEHDPFAPPSIAQALEHQKRWGMPPATEQLGSIASKTGEAAWNMLPTTIGAKWMATHSDDAPGQIDPSDAARGAADVALNTTGSGMLGAERGALGTAGGQIKAYHGSPHDFDKFDLSKIGTGEGAQAYGHGLYFAENEDVAKGYRRNLSTGNMSDPNDVAATYLNGLSDRKAAVEALRDNAEKFAKGDAVHPEVLRKAADMLSDEKFVPKPPGRMYEVAITADPEHFLDWDKPLSEQHPKVQDAIKKLSDSYDPGYFERNKADMANGPLGEKFKRGLLPRTYDPEDAMKAYGQAGIPGIKYADQGSRPPSQTDLAKAKSLLAGAEMNGDPAWIAKQRANVAALEDRINRPQTRNYVVFDDNLIDIMKKYGIAGLGALPAMGAYHFKTQEAEGDPFKPQQKFASGGRVDTKPPLSTRKESHYSSMRGSADHRCGICSMFRAPHGCTAVFGYISPKGGACDWFRRGRAEGGSVNLDAADKEMHLSPQERALYERHLSNLRGPGGVTNPDGSRSSLYQAVQEHGGKYYNIPTVWDGKRETEPWTRPSGQTMDVPNATALGNVDNAGWDTFPSYDTPDAADARYDQMHGFMEKDTQDYLQPRASGGRVMAHYIDKNPTPAQREQGNYKKAHLSIHGIPLAIETAKGSERSGIGADGKKWKVPSLPYHYGYAKKSEASDGDAVDVMLGPHTQSRKVFVVDQHDAKTGKYDEAKCLVGYGSAAQARAFYLKGFSDGKGEARLGHMAEMDVDQFRSWLRDGDTTKPIKGSDYDLPTVDREHDVRWISELSRDGRVCFIDRTLPRQVKNNGKMLDPAQPLLRHEHAEYKAMREAESEFRKEHGREPKIAGRMVIYKTAHRKRGNVAEKRWIENNGYLWAPWEAWCRGELSRLEHRRITNPPPSPDVKPAPHRRGDLEETISGQTLKG